MSNQIYEVMGKIIWSIENDFENQSKKILSDLRRSINGSQENVYQILSYIYPFIEDDYHKEDELTYLERAIITSLQLYAIHRTASESIITKDRDDIGHSLKFLRGQNSKAIDKRFTSMITSESYKGLEHYLRQLVKLIKSKKDGVPIKVNYSMLAEDLYFFQLGEESKQKVLLRWSKSYFKI